MPLNARVLKAAPARLARLLKIARALPEVDCQPAGTGHWSFTIRKKAFAYYQHDHHGDGMIALVVKSTRLAQRGLIAGDSLSYFSPAYLGAKGWAGMRLDLPRLDWDEVEQVLREGYRLTAPKKLAALLES